MGYRKSNSKRKEHSNKHIHQEKRKKTQINILILNLKELEKEKSKPDDSRRKEMINIRVEINEIVNRIQKNNKIRVEICLEICGKKKKISFMIVSQTTK